MSRPLVLAASLALLTLSAPGAGALQTPPPSTVPYLTVDTLAEEVFVLHRTKPLGYLVAPNNLVVVGDEDVTVVDTDMTMAGAREAIAAIRRITSKPVRFVVTTHWHDDHVIGNRAFAEAWPGVEFIAHAATVKGMTDDANTMRTTALRDWPGIMDGVRGLVERREWVDGSPLSEADRQTLASDVELGERYLAQIPEVVETLPTMLVEDRLVLRRGRHTIDIRWLGRAATDGDLVVHLPQDGVIATGDLLTWPVLFGAVSSVRGVATALDSVAMLPHTVLVPGHGNVMRSDRELDFVRGTLAEVERQAAESVSQGRTLEEARTAFRLAPFRAEVAGDSKLLASLFDGYFAGAIGDLAYNEAKAAAAPSGTGP